MKHVFVYSLLMVLAAMPASAQDSDTEVEQGFDLLQEGMDLLLQGLMKEIGPALLELEGKIIDLNAYEFPEVLPNGDIIIRRKAQLVPPADGETDL